MGSKEQGRETDRDAVSSDIPGRIDPDRAADAAPGDLVEGDELLDEALEETFPGSDPIAPKRIT